MINALGPEERSEMGDLVREFFRGDADKVRDWWSTPNPMFGGVSPASMTLIGREATVYRYIKHAREASGPNWLCGNPPGLS